MAAGLDFKAKTALAVQSARVDLSNFHLARYRQIDGFLITGKNSGTHWLKCMLSHALAHDFGLPPPSRTSGRDAEDFIGHPRWPQKHPGLPRIGSSHNLPSALVGLPLVRQALGMPPVVVLVRDILEAMLSHYVKWRPTLGMSLADYARSPAPGRRKVADVWWYMDFFNRWGQAACDNPGEIIVVRYEDLRQDTGSWLRRAARHMGVDLTDGAVDAALAASAKEFLRERLDPAYGEEIVPDRTLRAATRFSDADRDHLRAIMAERLKFDFGYGYAAAATRRMPAPVVSFVSAACGAD